MTGGPPKNIPSKRQTSGGMTGRLWLVESQGHDGTQSQQNHEELESYIGITCIW